MKSFMFLLISSCLTFSLFLHICSGNINGEFKLQSSTSDIYQAGTLDGSAYGIFGRKVWILGGIKDGSTTDDTRYIDLDSFNITILPSEYNAPTSFSLETQSFACTNDSIYYTRTLTTDFYQFNTTSLSYSVLPVPSTQFRLQCMVSVYNKSGNTWYIYGIGGANSGYWPWTNSAYRFNTLTNEWKIVDNMQLNIARYYHSCINYKNEKIFIFGAAIINSFNISEVCYLNNDSPGCYLLNDNINGVMNGNKYKVQLLLINDIIWIIGGYNGTVSGVPTTKSIQLFNASSDTFIDTGIQLQLVQPRVDAVIVYDDKYQSIIAIKGIIRVSDKTNVQTWSIGCFVIDNVLNTEADYSQQYCNFSTNTSISSDIIETTEAEIPTGYPIVYPTTYPTVYPIVYPTMYPTVYPSLHITSHPTSDSTSDPTRSPTDEPGTSPTILPTETVSATPTAQITIARTTMAQTGMATFTPSVDRTVNNNTNKTIYYSNLTTVVDQDIDINNLNIKYDSIIKQFETVGTLLPVCLFGSAILLYIISNNVIRARVPKIQRRGTDKPKLYCLLQFASNVSDFWTDIMFSGILYHSTDNNKVMNRLFVYSLLATLIPHIICLIVCLYFIIKWHKKDKRLDDYFNKYEAITVFFTLISGFYSTITLFQCQILFIPLFYIPLKNKEKKTLTFCKFGNIVLLEVSFFWSIKLNI